jgi:hypothetical protein
MTTCSRLDRTTRPNATILFSRIASRIKAAKGPDQREMLLPIAGGAPEKEVVERQVTQKPGGRKKAG